MLRRQYDGYIGWGRARGQDMIMALQWLLENYPEDQREILFDNMRLLKEAAFDWPRFFSEDVFPMGDLDTIPSNDLQYDLVHVVNLGQALKSSAIVRRYTHNDVLLDTARNSVNWTFIYHGAPSGAIIGDERISGVSPTRGTELCSVVETMFSLSYLYKAIGDRYFADRCELAAFNALPVMISPDSWAHQYVAQSNQPYSIHLKETPFWNVNDRGQTFGLEPHFPCCTVNHPQGYPKFASNMFVKAGTNGIGHALLSPGRVRYLLNQDNKVDIRCQTHYPFGQSLEYTIIAQKSFDFYVRVPEWYLPQDSYVRVNGGTPKPLRPDPETGMHKIVINKTITVIQYHLGAEIKVENRQNETVAIHYGPLLYALEITTIITSAEPSDWNSQQTLPQSWYTEQTRDYTISNTSAWAYAIDTSTLKFYSTSLGKSPATTSDLPNPIFQQGAPPTFITVQACEVAWGYSRGVPAEPPLPGHRRCTSKPREVKLIPYGAAKIHIAEFPVVDISSPRETIFNGDKTQQVLAFHD
ncbi:MAG: hypothetical protein M1829_005488 [Trizodia sp. TS-e1964]|nr:MAG: hypothetical protein M1829_005488 [Trizodia sp. TS-e1964]